ncbi:MAG: PAS domain S-box protein [Bacteroidota bacterium]|nr:PAS domain S-box protein [Bacteroidota bacterium]
MHILQDLKGFFSRLGAHEHGEHERAQTARDAEREARESTAERRLAALLDQLPYVILYETGGGREYISRNIEQLLGYEADELTAGDGRFTALIHPNDNANLQQRLAEWAEHGRPGAFHAQFRVRKRSGEYIWLEDQIVAVDYSGGTAEARQGMIGVMVDITPRHSAQSRYQAIVEAADVSGIGLVIIVSRNNLPVVLFINSAALAITAHAPSEVIGQPIMQFVAEQERPKIEQIWQQFLQHQLVHDTMEIEVMHQDGHLVPVSAGFSGIELDEEPAVIAFMTDSTERRKAEQELIQAKMEAEEISHIKSNILSNFSHELRTPLHSILGFSALLAEEIKDSSLREYALSIERSGQRLLATVTSIIEIAQLESGVGDLVLYPMPISEALETEVETFKPQFDARGLDLQLLLHRHDLIVLLEKNRFRKAIEKVIGNALKFTHYGSVRIDLSVEEEVGKTAQAVIRVRDTGIGMSPEFVKTAFEKFKQESSGFNRSYEGTGLGLPIARSYIRQMSGTIDIVSEPGEGTEVTIRFPIVAKIPSGGYSLPPGSRAN